MAVEALRWQDGRLSIIDQTLLPTECRYIELKTVAEVWEAIKTLRVRGAPAIGICAGFGVLVAIEEQQPETAAEGARVVREAVEYLATSRPTAVNLFWALDRMTRAAERAVKSSAPAWRKVMEAEAQAIYVEEVAACRAIGNHGAGLIRDGDGILTHCNAGGLATGEYGTALAVMYRAQELGRRFRVFADETRPLLQGARLTAWELMQAGIDVTLICDNMAAQVMREGRIQLVVVGADRIAANGDTANKIGTYSVAVLARAHEIPFYVAAPGSTIDRRLFDGSAIPIEQRDPAEIIHGFGRATAPANVAVYNPAFDVTPADLIAGIITEKGIIRPPYEQNLAEAATGRSR